MQSTCKGFSTDVTIPASLIVCARNEEKNLPTLLLALQNQKHPLLDIILVNDNSSDQTGILMEEWKNKHPSKVRVLHLDKHHIRHAAGKKEAFQMGVKAAQHDIILTTDADCLPISPQWANYMTTCMDSQTDFVLGHSPVHNGLLISAWDNYTTALQYLSYAAAGIPYMGVGRNMAFRKQKWLTFQGDAGHSKLESGDDDLPVNQLANRHNTKVCLHPNSFVMTSGETSGWEWIRRKIRHSRTGLWYKPIHLFLLTTFTAAKGIYFISCIVCLLLAPFTYILLLIVPGLLYFLLIRNTFNKLGYEHLKKWFPIADLVHFFALSILPLLLLLPGKDYWRHKKLSD